MKIWIQDCPRPRKKNTSGQTIACADLSVGWFRFWKVRGLCRFRVYLWGRWCGLQEGESCGRIDGRYPYQTTKLPAKPPNQTQPDSMDSKWPWTSSVPKVWRRPFASFGGSRLRHHYCISLRSILETPTSRDWLKMADSLIPPTSWSDLDSKHLPQSRLSLWELRSCCMSAIPWVIQVGCDSGAVVNGWVPNPLAKYFNNLRRWMLSTSA